MNYIKEKPELVKLILDQGDLVQVCEGYGRFYQYEDMEMFLDVTGHYLIYKLVDGGINHLYTGAYQQ